LNKKYKNKRNAKKKHLSIQLNKKIYQLYMRSSAAKSKDLAISGEVKTPLFSDAAETEISKT
jgi:hypothetical protein